MTERKLTMEDIKKLKVLVTERSFMSLRVRQIGSLLHDLEAAEAENEQLRDEILRLQRGINYSPPEEA